MCRASQIGAEQLRAIDPLHEGFAPTLTHRLGASLRFSSPPRGLRSLPVPQTKVRREVEPGEKRHRRERLKFLQLLLIQQHEGAEGFKSTRALWDKLKVFNVRSILEMPVEFKIRERGMRIDPNQEPQASTETDGNPPSKALSISLANNALISENQAVLSGTHSQVKALVAQAARLPGVRRERVYALRQTVQGGLYHPGPELVAGAMFEHMIAGSAS